METPKTLELDKKTAGFLLVPVLSLLQGLMAAEE